MVPNTLLLLFSLLRVVGLLKLLMILDLNIEVQSSLDYDPRESIWMKTSIMKSVIVQPPKLNNGRSGTGSP